MKKILFALEWHLLINNPVRAISTWYILNHTEEVHHRANFLMRDYCRRESAEHAQKMIRGLSNNEEL
jgi:hypothetical protein